MTSSGEAQDVLRALLERIDPSARVDQNELASPIYEVRIYGRHVGFVEIDHDGRLKRWI